MKLLVIIGMFASSLFTAAMQVSVGAQQHEKMPLLLIVSGELAREKAFTSQLVRNLQLSKQLTVHVLATPTKFTAKTVYRLKKQFKQPISLLIYYQAGELLWELYDMLSNQQMGSGKQNVLPSKEVSKRKITVTDADKLADDVWPVLMGVESSFATCIVACKYVGRIGRHPITHLYAFSPTHRPLDRDGTVPLLTTQTTNLAPRFHPTKPLLYYSQMTPRNMRLLVMDCEKKEKVVVDFPGHNMTPALAPDGKLVVGISSHGCEKLYLCEQEQCKKGIKRFVSLTDSSMHALNPSFISDDELVFCAVDRRKLPRIALLTIKNRSAAFLTGKEFCVSPAYCAANDTIAYCKKIKGTLQLCTYDRKSKRHKVLTCDGGDKDECCWSPCGHYIVFKYSYKKQSRIALWHCALKRYFFMTPEDEHWSFPTWSPCYARGSLFR